MKGRIFLKSASLGLDFPLCHGMWNGPILKLHNISTFLFNATPRWEQIKRAGSRGNCGLRRLFRDDSERVEKRSLRGKRKGENFKKSLKLRKREKNAQNPDRIFRSCLTGVLFRVPRASRKELKNAITKKNKKKLFYDKM